MAAAVREGATTVYLESATPDTLAEAAAVCRERGAALVWKWPSITRRGFLDAVTPLLPSLYDAGVRGVMVSGMGAADAVRQAEPRMALYGAAGLNLWNHRTARALAPIFRRCTASPELPAADLARLAEAAGEAPELEVLVQGNIEALVTEDRLVAVVSGRKPGEGFLALVDQRNRAFPLRHDTEGRTYVANAVETCLVDRLPRLVGTGIDAVAVDARGRGARYAGEMARFYREGIDAAGRGDSRTLAALKDGIKQRALGGITGGHFVRGLEE